MSKNNNFEFLLFTAADECSKKQAEEFLNIDDTGFEITERQRKRMKQLVRKCTKKEKSRAYALKWKWIAAACVLSLSIILTACVSIPEIRDAIKDFFLEWYDDFVSIGFGEKSDAEQYPDYDKIMPGDQPNTNENSSDNSSGESTKENNVTPPTEILNKAYATYLPKDCIHTVKVDTKYYYLVNYYYNGNLMFSLTQNIIDNESYWADNDNQTIYKAKVNGYEAIIAEKNGEHKTYFIIWQDNEYKYTITGVFDNIDELIKVAESVKV